jgi:excisionase family DNA binding protein
MTDKQITDFKQVCKNMEEHPFLTIEDVSSELGVSKRTIQTYISSGQLDSVKWKNKRLIKSVSIISFLLKKKLIEMSDVSEKIIVRDLDLQKE